MKKRLTILYILLFLLIIMGSISCATHSPELMTDQPPGFLKGLLHGFIILFSFIAELFTDYKIYAYPNSGGWYDFGFLLGVMIFFGGGASRARR